MANLIFNSVSYGVSDANRIEIRVVAGFDASPGGVHTFTINDASGKYEWRFNDTGAWNNTNTGFTQVNTSFILQFSLRLIDPADPITPSAAPVFTITHDAPVPGTLLASSYNVPGLNERITATDTGTTLTVPLGTAPTIAYLSSNNTEYFVPSDDVVELAHFISPDGVQDPNVNAVRVITSNLTSLANLSNNYVSGTAKDTFNGDISKWDVSNVTDMSYALAATSAGGAFNQNIGNWDVSNVVNFSFFLQNQASFDQPIGGWDTSSATDMSFMLNMHFSLSGSFNQPIGSWDVSNTETFLAMFSYQVVFNQPLNTWVLNTNGAVNISFSGMFQNCEAFNQDLDNWNTIRVTDMSSMFNGAYNFNGNITTWNTSNVTTLRNTFRGAFGKPQSTFNVDIGGWDVSNVIDMSFTFTDCLFNQDIGNWDTSSVEQTRQTFGANIGNPPNVFNQDISGWDMSSNTNMQRMFLNNSAFNQPIGSWNTVLVTRTDNMFQDATAFNQDISAWDTTSLTNMNFMFSGATSYNQDLGLMSVPGIASKPGAFDTGAGFEGDDARQPVWNGFVPTPSTSGIFTVANGNTFILIVTYPVTITPTVFNGFSNYALDGTIVTPTAAQGTLSPVIGGNTITITYTAPATGYGVLGPLYLAYGHAEDGSPALAGRSNLGITFVYGNVPPPVINPPSTPANPANTPSTVTTGLTPTQRNVAVATAVLIFIFIALMMV